MGSLCQARIVLVLAVMGLASAPSLAGPLDPTNFASSSLGAFPSVAGVYSINTSASTAPTLTEPGGMILSGLYYQDTPGHTVAVFNFSSINLTSAETITATGAVPLALLSLGDATIAGTINGNGTLGTSGPGGGTFSNPGPGAGTFITAQGGGSGFGGQGGTSGIFTFSDPQPNGPTFIPAISGGGTYGNLAVSLQGGSLNEGGAGAGGGIEIGAIGALNVLAGGLIEANGASDSIFGGGGSGGGIFLHATTINLATGSTISVQGGNGGSAGFIGGPGGGSGGGGGGGGGGQILLQYSDLTDSHISATMNTKGGIGLGGTVYTGGINDGSSGEVTINGTVVPEPSSIVMVTLSTVIALGYGWNRRRRPSDC